MKLTMIITKGCKIEMISSHNFDMTFLPLPNFSDSSRLRLFVGVIKKKDTNRIKKRKRYRLNTAVLLCLNKLDQIISLSVYGGLQLMEQEDKPSMLLIDSS